MQVDFDLFDVLADVVVFVVLELDEQRPLVSFVMIIARKELVSVADQQTFLDDVLAFVLEFIAANFVFFGVGVAEEIVEDGVRFEVTRAGAKVAEIFATDGTFEERVRGDDEPLEAEKAERVSAESRHRFE